MRRKKKSLVILISGLILAFVFGLFLVWQKKNDFKFNSGDIQSPNTQANADSNEDNGPKSPISGLSCDNAARRPFAVMLSGDAITRPLSGIGQADMVFEMQVVEDSINRFMAVFVCNSPSVIGSVRSARDDFIPLASGLDAIYAHWGGSHFALDELKNNVIDDLDALTNPYSAFYRQSGIAAPHNGFTSTNRIMTAAEKLKFSLEGNFAGYPHLTENQIISHGQERKVLAIEYPGIFRASYQYDPETNSYWRYRGGTKEIDKTIGKQVEVKNVVIMRAKSRPLEGQYNDVQVEGEGKAEFYLNGQTFAGSWKKDKNNIKSKLAFLDGNGQEVKFVPGSIWVEIADPGLSVTWQ
jgi:hypothetical protein